jgi:hypothetical protein
MQTDCKSTADGGAIAPEPTVRKPDPKTQADDKLKVQANDNGQQWPLISFPEDWYASR